MKSSHRVAVYVRSLLAHYPEILSAALVVICAASLPGPLWGQDQWTPNSNGSISYMFGSVGIGTTNPLNLVQIHAGSDLNLGIRYDPNAGGIGLGAFNDAGTAPTPLGFNASQFLFVNGNVGIGTTAPSTPLNVWGPGTTADMIRASWNAGTGTDIFNFNVRSIQNAGWIDWVLRTNDNAGGVHDALTIRGLNGNVGIGTTAPSFPLHVYGPSTSNTQVALFAGAGLSGTTPDTEVHISGGTGSTPGYAQLAFDDRGGGLWSVYKDSANQFNITHFGAPAILTSPAGGNALYLMPGGNGNVGIGTTNPTNTLSVNGTIQAKEVLVNTNWSDYVFAPGYQLLGLKDTAAYIQENHHLPNIPSAQEVEEKGVSLGDMQAKLLAKMRMSGRS